MMRRKRVVLSAIKIALPCCNICTTLTDPLMRHLKIYRAIRLIARAGSIRGGAEALAISPSALNRAVQAFEDEMDVAIFERIPGGVSLSSAGELLLDMIERHLTEFDDLQNQLTELRNGLSGTLRLSLGSDLDAGLVPDAIEIFEAAFPGVSLEVRTDDSTQSLQQRAVDLAILTNPSIDDAVEVVLSQSVPLAARRAGQTETAPVSGLWDIIDDRLMLPPHGTGTRSVMGHALRRHRLKEGVTTTLCAAQMLKHKAGAASVCILPEIALCDDDSIPPPERLQISLGKVQFAVVRSVRAPLIRPAQAFLTILERELDGVSSAHAVAQ